jgi:hypothetical protein
MEAAATVDADNPQDIRLSGRRTLTLEGAGHAIVVRTEVAETFDFCRLTADITRDGRQFFRRDWDLDLRQSAWRIRHSMEALKSQRARAEFGR